MSEPSIKDELHLVLVLFALLLGFAAVVAVEIVVWFVRLPVRLWRKCR